MTSTVHARAAQRPDRAVLRPARRLVVATVGVVLVVALGVALCLAGVAFPAASGRVHPSSIWLLVIAVGLVWSAAAVLRRPVPEDPAVVVDRVSAPGLIDLVDVIAFDLGVQAPHTVHVGLAVEARLEHRSGEPALLIGAPVVWGATQDELVGLLRLVLATAPEAALREVRWARTITAKVFQAPLEGLLTGSLFRLLRRAATRWATELELRLEQVTAARTSRADVCRLDDLEHVERAWLHVVHGWAVPAWRRGRGPTHLGAALAELLSGTERAWVGEDAGPLARGLLHDAAAVDRELSALAASALSGGSPTTSLDWPDYDTAVLGPARREAASRLLTAVDRVLGSPGPATPLRLLDALDAGAAAAVTGLLAGEPATGSEDDSLLFDALSAFVVCAAETSGAGRIALSWATGPVLVTDGERPDVVTALQQATTGRTAALRNALPALGVPLDAPVWTSGDDVPDVGPQAVAAVADIWRKGGLHDLVLCRDRLLLVQVTGRIDVRGAVEHFAGDRSGKDDRLRRLLEADLRTVAASPSTVEVLLADVIDVRLRVFLGRLMWRAVVTTADGQTVLRNGRSPGTAHALREILTPALGDRLRVHGLDPRFPRLARVAPLWALSCVGLAATVLAVFGWVIQAGEVVPATVVAQVDARRCVVTYVDPWRSAPAQAEIACPRLLAAPLDVLALPAPLRGDAVRADSARAWPVVATAVLIVPAACGVALQVRRTRRDERQAQEPGGD